MFPLVLMTVMDDDDRNYMITIYEQYQWLMLVTARRYVQTSYDQEEIISEACLALIKKIPTLRTLESKKLSAYIATTVRLRLHESSDIMALSQQRGCHHGEITASA